MTHISKCSFAAARFCRSITIAAASPRSTSVKEVSAGARVRPSIPLGAIGAAGRKNPAAIAFPAWRARVSVASA